ncbi:DoxX family protein [Flavobacterium sp.]|uniref:DoxX family protein n=1 Tax=Flavobacterium sp. TaxID=239 RepID=UPI003C531646
MRFKNISWILRIMVAGIFLQTLYFKFTGAPESIYIFSTLGLEPYGRLGTGILELISSILILIPSTTYIGALLGCSVLIGAILSHLFVLGIEVQNDGGLLFSLALIAFFCCVILVCQNKNRILKLL